MVRGRSGTIPAQAPSIPTEKGEKHTEPQTSRGERMTEKERVGDVVKEVTTVGKGSKGGRYIR